MSVDDRLRIDFVLQIGLVSERLTVNEATPLVYKGTMYLPNASDVTQAINAATGDMLWESRRAIPEDIAKWFQGAPLKNRNLAIYGNNIVDLGVDDFVYAISDVGVRVAKVDSLSTTIATAVFPTSN